MRRGFSLWEVLLVVAFTAIATLHAWSALRPSSPPSWSIDPDWAARFAKQYGAEHFSAGLEEYMVREYLHDRRGGTFVDVGSYHAKAGSNTFRLERDFGWSGLAIDANSAVAPEYVTQRPRTAFEVAFIGDSDTGLGTLFVPKADSGVASGDKQFTEQWGAIAKTVSVPNRTLNSLLAQHRIDHIDFMSIDIELSEPAALRGFDIDRYRPLLVAIEAHPPVRDAILEYFAQHRYVLVGEYLRADPLNYWFRPLADHLTR
jgi:hypothetical protein